MYTPSIFWACRRGLVVAGIPERPGCCAGLAALQRTDYVERNGTVSDTYSFQWWVVVFQFITLIGKSAAAPRKVGTLCQNEHIEIVAVLSA